MADEVLKIDEEYVLVDCIPVELCSRCGVINDNKGAC